jgi:hypothetical protein
MLKNMHSTLPVDAKLVPPEQVTVALAELASTAYEDLLALAWGGVEEALPSVASIGIRGVTG